MKSTLLKSELESFSISYADLSKHISYTPTAIGNWFYRDSINDERYNLIKRAMEKILEERYQQALRNKQAIYG